MTLWILLGVTIALEVAVLRRLAFDWVIVGIVLAGTALSFDYLTYTSIAERNYDGSSHVEYIQFIREQGRVPEVLSCGVCGHPPLYYAVAALWSKVTLFAVPLELGLQWLSLLLFFGFVVFALLVLRSSMKDGVILWLAAALVVFWPSSVIHAVRVHNDALASLLMLAAIYWVAEWDRHGREQDFAAALVATTLALFTKSSGYAVAAIVIVVVAWRVVSKQETRRRGLLRGASAGCVFAVAGFLAVGLRDAPSAQTRCPSILGSACGGRYVPPLPDTLHRFVSFDPSDFVRRMEIVPLDPFPHRFLKSTLFGVKQLGSEFSGAPYATLAAVMSLLLLVMVPVSVIGALGARSASLRKYRVYLLSPVILFAFLMAFRLRVPNGYHEDFRHIFPALVPFCLGYAKAVERLGRRSLVARYAGVTAGLAMVSASMAFFMRPP